MVSPALSHGKGDGMKRSALSRIGSLVGLVYLAYLCFMLVYAENPRAFSFEAAGFSLRVAVLLPCALMTAAAVLLSWIGFAARKRGPLLAAAIVYLTALPLVIEICAIPLSLSLLALADFFASLARERNGNTTKAPIDPSPETGGTDETKPIEDIEVALDDGSLGDSGSDPDDHLNGGPGCELADDSCDDLRLETLLEDVTDGADDENRPRADGMSVFLGIFMGLTALALIGMVACGVMGGKLPFMP